MQEQNVEERSQIVILGMHRSGTSLATSFFMRMGAHVGEAGELLPPRMDNPGGFWERRDAFRANKHVLRKCNCNWYTVRHFNVHDIGKRAERNFLKEAKATVNQLNRHRPWVVKDPRMCLLYPLWEPLLENPLCVIVHRNPVNAALSMYKRNKFAISFGLALWEYYTVAALNVSAKSARFFISFEELVQDPVQSAQVLYEESILRKVQGLHKPDEDEIQDSIRERVGLSGNKKYRHDKEVSPYQAELWDLLRTNDESKLSQPLKVSRESLARLAEFERRSYAQSSFKTKMRYQRRRLARALGRPQSGHQ